MQTLFQDREAGRPRAGESDSAYSQRTGRPMPTHGRRGASTLCGKLLAHGGIVCLEDPAGDYAVTCGKCRAMLRKIAGVS